MITHTEQQKIWDEEHNKPNVLLQMDSSEASSGVVQFWNFLKEKGLSNPKGLEMGCGKGRNVIWLAKQGVDAYGFDFSPAAIEEAQRRTKKENVNAHFDVMDATTPWKYESDSFDFAIDCFASTDIESSEGRAFAQKEFLRVLKPGGYLLAYLMSTDDEFHKEMVAKSPAEEKNAFYHPTGKFEKIFDEHEVAEMYKNFTLIEKKRIEKTAVFKGKGYACKHFWLIMQKPLS